MYDAGDNDDLAKGMVDGESFRYFAPVSFFEKADAPKGQQRRFGGVATTESADQQDETILQRGLDFESYFLKQGWFNDNHSKESGGIVGYPAGVQFFKKGERLPDGATAKTNLHWSEGYLLEGHPPADRIWSAGQALQKSGGGRRLGQSIEGKVLRRAGPGGKVIAEALVRNIAITHCPVNADSSLNFLAKALAAVEKSDGMALPPHGAGEGGSAADQHEDEAKSLTAGASSAPAATLGPRTGDAGRILSPQSLEHDVHSTDVHSTTYSTGSITKSLTRGEAMDAIFARFPGVPAATAGRMLDLAMQTRGRP